MKKQLVDVDDRDRRFDPFRLLGPEERSRHIGAYRSFLEARNGKIDLEGRCLARREQFFGSLVMKPVVSAKPGDRVGFRKRLRSEGKVRIDQATAWLVAAAKASEAETYGVHLELEKYDRDERHVRDGRFLVESADDAEVAQLYIFMEELYHGRLLTEMCATLGYEMNNDPPRWRMRLLIHLTSPICSPDTTLRLQCRSRPFDWNRRQMKAGRIKGVWFSCIGASFPSGRKTGAFPAS